MSSLPSLLLNPLPIPIPDITLDLVNMFNTISMVKARDLIYAHFPHLLLLFDVLYFYPSRWYRDPTGNRKYFMRQEGSSQGCPFAAFLACLVLNEVLTPIAPSLAQCSNRCKANPIQGMVVLEALLRVYVDDCTVSLSYPNLLFFMETLQCMMKHFGQANGTPLTSNKWDNMLVCDDFIQNIQNENYEDIKNEPVAIQKYFKAMNANNKMIRCQPKYKYSLEDWKWHIQHVKEKTSTSPAGRH